MYSKKTPQGFIIRLQKNEKLIEQLTKFCAKNKIHSGSISGLGAALKAEIGFYHLDQKQYTWKTFDQPLEIATLTGNIAMVDAKPFLHIHTALSDQNFQCLAGHLKELTVGATCEIHIAPFDGQIRRIHDEKIGLKLLDLK
jgi:predicted DNA-binding protein with PD1-like motif